MTSYTVSDDALCSERARAYFTKADRRVMIGLRQTLDILQIPLPDYAQRNPPGRTPGKEVLAAFHADHPRPLNHVLAPRKPDADRLGG